MHNGLLTLEWHDNTTRIWLNIDVWHQLQIYGRLAQVLQFFAWWNLHSHLKVTLKNLTSLGIYPRSCAHEHKRLFNGRYRNLLLKECTRFLLALPPPMVSQHTGRAWEARSPWWLVPPLFLGYLATHVCSHVSWFGQCSGHLRAQLLLGLNWCHGCLCRSCNRYRFNWKMNN